MGSAVRVFLLAAVSVAWLVPGVQTWQILERLHGMDVAPDAIVLRSALTSIQWTVGLMAAATIVWVLQLIGEHQVARRESDLQAGLHAAQQRLDQDVEHLSDVLRHSTSAIQGDFGNFTSVGTRLRNALETRLGAIETMLRRQQELQTLAFSSMEPLEPVRQRLEALQHTVGGALHELNFTVEHHLHGLQAELAERDQRVQTDFGSLDSRLNDENDRWENRLRVLEGHFVELTQKSALDGAKVSANLKLMNLRLKELAQAVQHG